MPPNPILDPATLAALDRIDLASRRRRRRPRSGEHPAWERGREEEFREHRPYVIGDDRRSIDWRASARTGRWLVKERHEPARRGVWILLDASRSMDFPLGSPGGATKFDRARELAAALSYLALRNADRVELFEGGIAGARHLGTLKPGPRAADRIRAALSTRSPVGRQELSPALEQLAGRRRTGGLLAVLSDFYGDETRLRLALRAAGCAGDDAVAFHVLSAAEEVLAADSLSVRDAESGRVRDVPKTAAAAYARNLADWRRELKTAAARGGFEMVAPDSRQPVLEIVSRWIDPR